MPWSDNSDLTIRRNIFHFPNISLKLVSFLALAGQTAEELRQGQEHGHRYGHGLHEPHSFHINQGRGDLEPGHLFSPSNVQVNIIPVALCLPVPAYPPSPPSSLAFLLLSLSSSRLSLLQPPCAYTQHNLL